MNRKLNSNRFLPEFVTSFKDRHKKVRLRFRRKGFKPGYFKAALGTEAFRVEYHAFLNPPSQLELIAERTIPGSLGDLVARYFSVPERLGPTETTQTKVRAVIEHYAEGRRERPVALLTFEHIDAAIAKRRVQTIVKGRRAGGVEAARKMRKELIRLFAFGVKIGLMKSNPAADSDRIKVAPSERSTGFYSWTEEDIAQYRAKHALGTKPRLAMELMLWTDQRKVDTIHLGPQHIRNGRFHVKQTKGGKQLALTIAPQLQAAIAAMPHAGEQLCFLLTEQGKPFTVKGFGNWFRDQCDAAGLPQCTAHGLRKATMRRMAELDMGNQSMKAVSGHTKDDEVAVYTAAANQMRMADTAIGALSAWESLTTSNGLDTDPPQRAVNDG